MNTKDNVSVWQDNQTNSVDDSEFDLELQISNPRMELAKNTPPMLGTHSCGGTCNSCWTCGGSCPSWC